MSGKKFSNILCGHVSKPIENDKMSGNNYFNSLRKWRDESLYKRPIIKSFIFIFNNVLNF